MENDWKSRFEKEKKLAKELMGDPRYVEFINSTFLIGRYWNGDRIYPKHVMNSMKAVQNRMAGESTEDVPEFFRAFGHEMARVTDKFKREGSAHISGGIAYEVVDDVLYNIAEEGLDPNSYPFFLELTIAGILHKFYKVRFEDYQIDFYVGGQGLLPETYYIDINFRPVPKNISS